MTTSTSPETGAGEPQRPTGDSAAPARRSRLRLATVGGIAAIAILGGGITAAAAVTGTEVSVTAAPGATGSDAPPAPKVHGPHLDGTVMSASGSTVLIKDHEGFTRTIVESSTTTYRDGLTAALPVGSKIHAEGTVASNGTSLDASVIGVDKGPGAGGPGGKGPGGPGGPGRHTGPPAGAPTPPSTSAPATTK